MRPELSASYTVEAEESVLNALYYKDVEDALQAAERRECTWDVLDLAGTSVAYFVDRLGHPFEVRYDPPCVPIVPVDGVSRARYRLRRQRLPSGLTVHRFRPAIRRRASSSVSRGHSERFVSTGTSCG